MSSDLPVRLHRGVPVLSAVLWRRHHNPERRGTGDRCRRPVDRLQIPGSHRSPCQGKQRKHHCTLVKVGHFADLPFLSFSTEFKERAGLSAGGEDSQPRACGLAKPAVQRLRRHHSHHRPYHHPGEACRRQSGLWPSMGPKRTTHSFQWRWWWRRWLEATMCWAWEMTECILGHGG